MRRLVVATFMSLDGYVEGPGKNVMALPFDPWFDEYNLERIRAAEMLLAGRTTFEQIEAFWFPLADDPAASPLQHEIGRFNRDAPMVVVSDTLTEPRRPGPTTIVRRAEAAAQVERLRAEDGGDILVFGSRTTWNPLLSAGLVDELHLMIGPAAIGAGTPAFAGPTPRMELAEVRRFPGSSSVVLVYRPPVSDGGEG